MSTDPGSGAGRPPSADHPPVQHPAAYAGPAGPAGPAAYAAPAGHAGASGYPPPPGYLPPVSYAAPRPARGMGTGPTTSLPVTPPGAGWHPTPPSSLPTPPRPRPQGPGAAAVGVVVALTLLTLAGLLSAERLGAFDGPVLLTAGGVGVVLAGIAVVVSGLRGRTAGALGWIAVLGILTLLPFVSVERSGWGWYGTSTIVGEVDQTPLTVEEAEEGFSVAAGQVRIDLTELPTDRRGTVEVPISVGAGDVIVVLPRDGAFDAEITMHAGQVQWLDTFVAGVSTGVPETFESPAVEDGATPDLHLEIVVGAGNVRVTEE